MRYYDIQVGGGGWGWSSHQGDKADPGAQEVLLNLEVFRAGDDPGLGMTTSDNSTIEIKGVSWEQIKTSNQLINRTITVMGGMKPGLPLAEIQAKHAGKLFSGVIFKAWGNWVGTEMSIQLVCGPSVQNASSETTSSTSPGQPAPSGGGDQGASAQSVTMGQAQLLHANRAGLRSIRGRPYARGLIRASPLSDRVTTFDDGFDIGGILGGIGGIGGGGGSPSSINVGGILSSVIGGGFPGLSAPLNLIHNMMENMPLAAAIKQTLSTAFPGMGQNINISSLLKLNYQDAGVYQNMAQYATYILKLSRSIMNSTNYFGVHMAAHNDTAYANDFTAPTGSVLLTAFDFIGQPTWIDLVTVEIKVVMRADIIPFSQVTIPPGTLMNIAGGAIFPLTSQQRTNITLEGMTFNVVNIRHIGDFRNPDGNYWCTIITARSPNVGGSTFASQ